MGTYSFTVEYDAAVQDVYPVLGTFRAYREADTPIVCWVRTEDGKMDLSGVQTLEAVIPWGTPGWFWDYGIANHGPQLLIPAFSPEPGRVQFTVTAHNINNRLFNTFQQFLLRADNRVIGTGTLDIVG